MDINFTDIAKISTSLQEGEKLVVNEATGQIGKLGEHEVKLGPPAGTRLLTGDEFFDALARQTSKAFAENLQKKLAEPGKPLTERVIRQAVAESKDVIDETAAHLKNLTAGLKAKGDVRMQNAGDIQTFLASLKAMPEALDAPGVAKTVKKLESALKATEAAKSRLADVRGDDLFGRTSKSAVKLVGKLVAAEADLAEKLRTLSDKLLSIDSGRREEMGLSLDPVDDLATEMELNSLHLEELTGTLKAVEESDKGAVKAEFDRLLGKRVASADLAEADKAIAAFTKAARPFLTAVAALDTAKSDAPDAPGLLAAISGQFETVKTALARLKGTSGIDARAVKELETNLARMKARCDSCRGDVGAALQARRFEQLKVMIRHGLQEALALAESGKHGYTREAEGVLHALHETLYDCAEVLKDLDPGKSMREQCEVRDTLFEVVKLVRKAGLMARDVGLGDFEARFKKFFDGMCGGGSVIPVEKLDARILGEVLRGEIDLLNYVELKEDGYPPEMFDAALTDEGARKIGSAGEGTFNSVSFYSIPNVRTGVSNTHVVKNVELSQDSSATRSVAHVFSRAGHARNAAKLNFASWKGANLIDCGQSVTRSALVRIKGRYQLVQEAAPGKSIADMHNSFDGLKSRISGYSKSEQARIRREMQLQCARLEWADWLSGQLDRTAYNVLIGLDEAKGPDGQKYVTVTVKGIDNDASFPEGRTGIYDFKTVPGRNRPSETLMTRGEVSPEKVANLSDGAGVRGMRKPIFLPQSVKDRLANLDENAYRAEMAPYLSDDALEAAVARIREMKNEAASWPEDRIIDDGTPTRDLSEQEVQQEADRLDRLYRNDYQAVKGQVGEDNVDVAAGFYGYMMKM